MTDYQQDKLFSTIIEDEGCKRYAYEDSLGYLTIGIGRCIDEKKKGGLSMDEVMYLFNNDIKRCKDSMSKYPWWNKLDDVRQGVLIELCFNIGASGVDGFKKMLAAIADANYMVAGVELVDSKWSTQVQPSRVESMKFRLQYGRYQ